MEGFEAVARAVDLPDGALLGVQTRAGHHLCLVNDGGTIHALAALCTHREFPLADGTLLPGGRVECAWHGAQYDVRTGAPVEGPSDVPLAVYDVAIRDGMVCVGARRP